MSDFSVDDEGLFQQQAKEIEAGVNYARQQLSGMRKNGRCLFCSDPLEDPNGAYCDKYCREDHEKELHNKKVKGLL